MLNFDSDKRSMFDTENKCKILQEKNKVFFTEVISLRKELEHKDSELEKT
jgi:hypothetical protein